MQLNRSSEDEEFGIGAVSELFHRYLTGLILAMVVELGEVVPGFEHLTQETAIEAELVG